MSEMKDSGIEWIGKVPTDWHYIKLKTFYNFEKGKNAQRYTIDYIGQNEGTIPVYSGQTENNGIMGFVKDCDYEVSECLFTTTVGAKVMTPRILSGKFCLSQNCLIMKQIKTCNNHFFYYALLPLFDNEKASIPSYMQPSLRINDLNKYGFFVPSISEQNRIASFLDTKCAEIDVLTADIQKEIETLQEYRKSVITEAVTKGLDPDVEMKDSGIEWIGEIPKHWTTIKLKNTHDGMNVGESIDKEYWEESDGDIAFYTAGLNPITTTYRHFPPEKYTSGNDLLLARNGTPYVYLPIEKSVYTDHIIRVKIKDGYSKKYIMYCLQRSINAEVVDTVSIATWSASIWNRQCFPLPSYEEQKLIVSFLDTKCSEIDSIIADKQKQLETLAEYRKSLIYEYVTGKKEVPTA